MQAQFHSLVLFAALGVASRASDLAYWCCWLSIAFAWPTEEYWFKLEFEYIIDDDPGVISCAFQRETCGY
jgi:hypothetical protein